MQPLERLSLSDITNLAAEAPDTPMHQAVLARLDGKGLLDEHGHVRIHRIRRHLEGRLGRAPELRQVLHRTGRLQGRPLWIDDPNFDIANHVQVATLPPPGGEAAALCFAEAAMSELMDRGRPLWEMWFLEGYGGGKVGIFIKLHHALADGPAMLNMMAQLFELEPGELHVGKAGWEPQPPPGARAVLIENLARKQRFVANAGRRLVHPVKLLGAAAFSARATWEALRQTHGAPRTSLNRPIGSTRRIVALTFELEEVVAMAHSRGVKVNDVFLDVVAGGLRKVLAGRGELAPDMKIRTSMAVSLHPADDTAQVGNKVGTMVVPLPVGEPDAAARLALVAAETRRAKHTQLAAVPQATMAALAVTGLTRRYIRRQHMVNVLATNLRGPALPLYFAGAPLEDAVAIPPIAGNVTASFAALSYMGRFRLSVHADAGAWPDIDVLLRGMRSAWHELRQHNRPGASRLVGEPGPRVRPSSSPWQARSARGRSPGRRNRGSTPR